MAIEDVVAEYECAGAARDEIRADVEGLGQPLGSGCTRYSIRNPHWPPFPSSCWNAGLSCGVVMIGILADPGEHHHRQWIIDHGLVVDGHQLFADAGGDRIEARPSRRLE